MGIQTAAQFWNLRGSLRENNLELSIFDHRASKEGHNWYADDISPLLSVPSGVIVQRGIPAKGERVVPASQQRVPGTEFQNTGPPREATLRLRRGYSKVRG